MEVDGLPAAGHPVIQPDERGVKEMVDQSARATTEKPGAPSALSVVSVTKIYGKRKVLEDISLEVAPGEVVGLLGPNGAGKTICFYAIMGLIKPDRGRIILEERDLTRLPMYRRTALGLGYLPQEPSIFRGLTVAQNIQAAARLFEPDREKAAARVDALLADFHIEHLRDSPASGLSGGERRRCEFARALTAEPSIMLLDEPFAGIDPLSIADMKTLVGDLRKRGIGVLITDHDVHDTLELADRAYVICDGKMLFHGDPEALIADKDVRRLYLGENFTMPSTLG